MRQGAAILLREIVMTEAKAKRNRVDWDAVKHDYSTGILSDRALGSKHSVSHTAIQKRAKVEGWTKDLTARIRQKAEDKVAKDEVAKEVASESAATERQVIDANAEMLANVIRGHRKDVGRLRGVVSILLEKIEAILTESDLFAQIGEMCFSPNEAGIDKVNELYQKVIALPGQTDSTKKLAETMKILIDLERKVFKLDTQDDDADESARKAGAEAGRAVASGIDAAMKELADKIAAKSE